MAADDGCIQAVLKIGSIVGFPAAQVTRSHCRVAVGFGDTPPKASPPVPVADTVDLNFDSTFQIDTQGIGALDKLVESPVKITLFSVSGDARHSTPIFEFLFPLDELLLQRKLDVGADLIGKRVDENDLDINIPPPTIRVDFRVSDYLLSAEDAEGSAIVRIRVDGLKPVPKAVVSGTLHWDDKVHPFEYFVGFMFPGSRVLQLPAGQFVFDEPSFVRWESSLRAFLPAAAVREILVEGSVLDVEVWRDQNDDFAGFGINDTAALLATGRAAIPSAEFTKPGQSRFVGEICFRGKPAGVDSMRQQEAAKVEEELEAKKSGTKAGPKKVTSRVLVVRKKPRRVATAKDKKQVKVLQQALSELGEVDGFDGTQVLGIEIAFDHALVLKPLVPKPTRHPRDIAAGRTRIVGCGHHLAEATAEFRGVVRDMADEISLAQRKRQERQLNDPNYPNRLEGLLNESASWVTCNERLRNAMADVYSELVIARGVPGDQLQQLQEELPRYLFERVQAEVTEAVPAARAPGCMRAFLVKHAEEAEASLRPLAANVLLEELLALDLQSADSWWRYSRLMLKHGDVGRAEECIRRGLACDPNHIELSLAFASLTAGQQRFHDTIAFLRPLPAAKERLGKVALGVLHTLANLPDPEKAPPLSEEELISTAREFLDMGDVVFSEQLIAQVQMRSGETAVVLSMFGRLHYEMRDLVKANSFLARAVEQTRDGESLILLGHCDFERKRWATSVTLYEEGLELKFDATAALRLGIALLKTGEPKRAEGVLAKCSPQDAVVLVHLAMAAISLGKLSQADELLARASAINPRDPAMWAYNVVLLSRWGRLDEAKYCGAQAAKWGVDDEELQQLIANSLAELEKGPIVPIVPDAEDDGEEAID